MTLLADGGCRVVDNGRGIPVDPHPEYPDKSAAEIVLTMLHAGGKFGGEGYKISGGLHGVGVSVVNALVAPPRPRDRPRRRPLRADVRRRRRARRAAARASATPTSTGTSVTFWPDGTIMEELDFRAQTLVERLREMAFLNKGLEIVFRDERPDEPVEQIFKFDGGIVDFVVHLNASKEPLFPRVVSIGDTYDAGEVEIAMQWNSGYYEGIHSFANNIATTEGGMHEEGFKKSLTNVMNRYARAEGPPQGEGREPPRRRHPRGAHRDHLREAAQPAVRGADEDEARQHRDPLVRREGHERQARRVARRAPERGPHDRAEGAAGVAGAHGGPPGARPHAAQVAARVGVDAGQARRLLVAQSRRGRALHRRGRQRRRQREEGPQPDVPGDPADPRQDPERRAVAHRQDAAQRGDPGAHLRGRYRHRRRVRPRRSSATTRSSS